MLQRRWREKSRTDNDGGVIGADSVDEITRKDRSLFCFAVRSKVLLSVLLVTTTGLLVFYMPGILPRARSLLRRSNSTIAAETNTDWNDGDTNVAIAVLFTTPSQKKDDSGTYRERSLSPDSIDAAAVLRRSAEKAGGADSRYNITYLALITPEIDKKWVQVIEKFGYKPRRIEVPINSSEIRNTRVSELIQKDGRLGLNEIVKIEPLLFKEYHRVLVIDADFMFHRNFDELFDSSTLDPEKDALGWTEGGIDTEPMNGGFLLMNPRAANAAAHRNAILNILREGDYALGEKGWGDSGIGGNTFGGVTIQGLLPYYFLHRLNGTSCRQLDRCRYNNMVQLERCKATSLEDITSNHFTGDCAKPWQCVVARDKRGKKPRAPKVNIQGGALGIANVVAIVPENAGPSIQHTQAGHPMCVDFKNRWWEEQKEMAQELEIPIQRCGGTSLSQHVFDNL